MKLTVESKETGTVWELEIDSDKKTINDLLASEDWSENIESEYLSEDWIRKAKGFEVFGYDDEEIGEIMQEIKTFFEEQGLDTEEVEVLQKSSDDFEESGYDDYSDTDSEEDFGWSSDSDDEEDDDY